MSSREYLKEMGLVVKESKSRGRFLETEKPIPEGILTCNVGYYLGTTIMQCMPLSWAVTNECATTICHHCLRSVEKAPCCGRCGYTRYCSRVCQVEDWFDLESQAKWIGNVTNWSVAG